MLVETDAVEAEPIRELHLIEIFMIELGALFRIIVAVGKGDPGRAVCLDGGKIDVPIGHEVKIEEFHAAILIASRKPLSAAAKASGCSIWGRCPQPGMIVTLAPGMRLP